MVSGRVVPKLICLLALGLLSYYGNAQQGTFNQKLDPAKAQQDLDLLKGILEEANTTLYYYTSRKKVERAFARARASFKDSATYHGFIAAIASIMHTVSCGHSGWDHSAAYKAYRNKNEKLLPIDITIISGRYYLLRDCSREQKIPPFAEITEINGERVSVLTKRLTAYMYRDGDANSGSATEITAHFRMAYSNFIGRPDSFRVTYVPISGSFHAVETIAALPLTEIDSIKEVRYDPEESTGLPLHFYLIDSTSTAVYTAHTFSNELIPKAGQNFIPFTDSVFRVLNDQHIKNLIIDLRGNRGGWTANGRCLFEHFIDKPTPYIKRVYTKKYKDYSFASFITEDAGYEDTMKLELNKDGFYEWTNNPNLWATPAAYRYNGKVYVLIDAFTRSAASVFCSLMKEHTDAIFIGEETSASRSGTNGMVAYIKLPNTEIPYRFSTARYDFNVSRCMDHKGIRPHFEVRPDMESIRTGNDKVLQTTLRIITSQF